MKSILQHSCCIATLLADPQQRSRICQVAARAERRHATARASERRTRRRRPPPTHADKSKPADKPKSPATDQLSVEQARLADRFKRLEEVIGRLAELSAPTDPRRAKLLREAIAQSREQDVNTRFESIVKLLQDERLSAASTNQTELQKELDALLGLLLKADRDKELSSQRERIKNYIKEVDRIIRMQKGVRARTEGGDELKGLGDDQQNIATDTGKLGGDISKTDGDKTPDSDKPPKPGDKDQPKSDEKEKPKSDDKQKPKPDDKDKPKSDDKQKPGNDAPKPGEPSKPDDSQKPGDKSKSGKPSDSGKPQPSKSKPERRPALRRQTVQAKQFAPFRLATVARQTRLAIGR